MTLVLAKQGVQSFIAADRCITYGSIKQEGRKIEALTMPNGDRYLAGYSGNVALAKSVFEALRLGVARADITEICKTYESDPSCCLALAAKVPFKSKEGMELEGDNFEIYTIFNSGTFYRRDDHFIALGSGADFAYGYEAKSNNFNNVLFFDESLNELFKKAEERLTNLFFKHDTFLIKDEKLYHRDINFKYTNVTDWSNIYGD